MKKEPLHIVLISVHGLIRGRDLELGRDADTGGQTKYVVELSRALAESPGVSRVNLFTRRVVDPAVSKDYAERIEPLSDNAQIVRIDAGPDEYIRKEELWDHLDVFADNTVEFLSAQEQPPAIIHGHYPDAGYVGSRLSHILGIPLVFTGHSLGRVKRRRLLASGLKSDEIENRYNIKRRIEAEEETLANADLVVASTSNEIEEQYRLYDYYQPDCMAVVPPGTDLTRFFPPDGSEAEARILPEITRFLHDPGKAMILALSRPDERKNLETLVAAYGESAALQKAANLVIIAGNRDDIRDLDSGSRRVLIGLLMQIDHYDLYGRVAYPKQHAPDDVPVIYRLAAASGGVFVNPALTEPFGLTLIEAAATGLPIVATEDGGPQDIAGNCRNGLLIDPLDKAAMAKALLAVLSDRGRWQRFSRNGIEGVKRHYSWPAHARRYLEHVRPVVQRAEPLIRAPIVRRPLLFHDRALFTDLDQNLLGDPESLETFSQFIRENRRYTSFGIATGRGLLSALQVIKKYRIPRPDVLITGVGTEIYYAPQLTADLAWARHIAHTWNPDAIKRALDELPGLELQPRAEQTRFKVSYYIDPAEAPVLDEINSILLREEQPANLILSFGQFLDVLPVRASKGLALRYFANQFDIRLEHILVAGGSGADEDMMRGNTLAVVVANREEELSELTDTERIYFAEKPYASGILEAIEHYRFFERVGGPQS